MFIFGQKMNDCTVTSWSRIESRLIRQLGENYSYVWMRGGGRGGGGVIIHYGLEDGAKPPIIAKLKHYTSWLKHE
jgi:hypothetical protein